MVVDCDRRSKSVGQQRLCLKADGRAMYSKDGGGAT